MTDTNQKSDTTKSGLTGEPLAKVLTERDISHSAMMASWF